jgi:16S rRNA (cytosine1402-N4)-methyltransferase
MIMKHYSVLKNEIIDSLNILEDGIYVDATLGYAGMSEEMLKRLKNGKLICFDQDMDAINYSKEVLSKINNNYQIIHSNFVNLKEELIKLGINKIDGIIFDLGFSSPQVDEDKRGFSFMSDSYLDMRMDTNNKIDACYIVNNYSTKELEDIFYKYSDEANSKKIAKVITDKRKLKEIKTTKELVEIIKIAVGSNYFYKHHPERKIFQAIRIEVNNELDVLKKVLPDAIDLLNVGGRISVISFHSKEDKIVKDIFNKYSMVDDLVKGLPNIPEEYLPILKIVNKKPITASNRELEENSRSHSAKLRIGEKIR